jgi:hypothetical protein
MRSQLAVTLLGLVQWFLDYVGLVQWFLDYVGSGPVGFRLRCVWSSGFYTTLGLVRWFLD